MNSPLETIEGSYSSAVFTTYSLNLRFFEHWVLPLLHAAGARNVIIFVDEAQLGAALDDHGLRSVGRSYQLVSTRLGPGAFHPKLILLHGEEGTRVCVSSANLTVDGQLSKRRRAELSSTAASPATGRARRGRFLRAANRRRRARPHCRRAHRRLAGDRRREALPPPTVALVQTSTSRCCQRIPGVASRPRRPTATRARRRERLLSAARSR